MALTEVNSGRSWDGDEFIESLDELTELRHQRYSDSLMASVYGLVALLGTVASSGTVGQDISIENALLYVGTIGAGVLSGYLGFGIRDKNVQIHSLQQRVDQLRAREEAYDGNERYGRHVLPNEPE